MFHLFALVVWKSNTHDSWLFHRNSISCISTLCGSGCSYHLFTWRSHSPTSCRSSSALSWFIYWHGKDHKLCAVTFEIRMFLILLLGSDYFHHQVLNLGSHMSLFGKQDALKKCYQDMQDHVVDSNCQQQLPSKRKGFWCTSEPLSPVGVLEAAAAFSRTGSQSMTGSCHESSLDVSFAVTPTTAYKRRKLDDFCSSNAWL